MRHFKPRISQDELQEWFIYEPNTGRFFWRKSPCNSHLKGSEAGSLQGQHGKQRRMLWLKGRRIYASRAAYIYVHGDIPDAALLDHADGDSTNDRIENLRLASEAQNVWNREQRNGTRFRLGVAKDKRGRFKARIQMPSGKKLNLGTWETEGEAHAAYMGAAAVLHNDFWIGQRGD